MNSVVGVALVFKRSAAMLFRFSAVDPSCGLVTNQPDRFTGLGWMWVAMTMTLCFIGHSPHALATVLSRGDLFFTGIMSDNPDQFSFAMTVDVDASTEVYFTDNGWFAGGGFRSSENTVRWHSDAAISAGTVVSIETGKGSTTGSLTGNVPLLSSVGDQLIAYQSSNEGVDVNVIAALQNNGVWDVNATSSNTSAQPFAGFFSLALTPERDNWQYQGPREFVDVAGLRTALLDLTNWTGDNSRLVPDISKLTIPEPSSGLLLLVACLLWVARIGARSHLQG